MRRYLFLLVLPCLNSCTGTLFQSVGTRLAAPIAVAVDTVNLRAYVVNSNNNAEFTGTTLSILDITNPAAPTLLSASANPIGIPDFSGQIYLDPATRLAYVTNRLSDNNNDKVDALLRINLDEASASFGAIDTFADGENPFGITCCDSSGRIYVVANGGSLNVFQPSDLSTSVQVSLEVTLASGEKFSGRNSSEAVLLGAQAFITNRGDALYVINTDEVGDATKNPVDTIVTDAGNLRGIATDGTLLYAVDGGDGAEEGPQLRVINPSSLTAASPDSSSISEVAMSAAQTTTVALGNDPNEVAVFNGRAYVSNTDDDTVTVIELAGHTVVTTITVGDEPFGLTAFTLGATDYLYVTNLKGNSISIVDLTNGNTVVGTFAP